VAARATRGKAIAEGEPAMTATMPSEIREAISSALDRLKQPALAPTIQARSVRRFERKVALSRRAKQQMMELLRLASRAGPDETVRDWVQRLELQLQRLPISDLRSAPPGAVLEFAAGTQAVMGFGGRLYPADPHDRLLGVFAPT
jgi:hypothetical protein